MSGRKNAVRKNRRTNERSRSLSERLVGFLFTTVSSGALFAGRFMVRNPLLTGGATAFLVVMGFVSANALWYQPQPHDNTFFRTRPDLVFVPTPKSTLLSSTANNNDKQSELKSGVSQSTKPDDEVRDKLRQIASLNNVELSDELPALAPNADLEIAKIQQKLRSLGLYDGMVDGLPGPKTRQAVEQWQLLQKKAGEDVPATFESQKKATSPSIETIIQVAIPEARPRQQNAVSPDKISLKQQQPPAKLDAKLEQSARSDNIQVPSKTNAHPVTSQDIVRVQAGLKAFGNDLIIVDGVAGKSTQDAIRDFQKLFGMQITGQVDVELISKMREIGLIS